MPLQAQEFRHSNCEPFVFVLKTLDAQGLQIRNRLLSASAASVLHNCGPSKTIFNIFQRLFSRLRKATHFRDFERFTSRS